MMASSDISGALAIDGGDFYHIQTETGLAKTLAQFAHRCNPAPGFAWFTCGELWKPF
jgi:hypothetical protein